MAKESQSVGLSLGMLCLTMCFIYVVFFGMHGDALQAELASLEANEGAYALATTLSAAEATAPTPSSPPTTEPSPTPTPQGSPSPAKRPVDITTVPVAPAPENSPGRTFFSVQELFYDQSQPASPASRPSSVSPAPAAVQPQAQQTLQDPSKILLADTREWDGYMPRLDAVGLVPYQKYILKNMDNTHFVPLTDVPTNFLTTIQQKGGTVVEIAGKNAINRNQLFGDSVRYINLPAYEGVKVLMIVFFGNEAWFLQVDAPIFEERKAALAATFAPWYDW